MRIFMEGQEELLEPGGEAMVVLAKLMVGGAVIALVWGAVTHFFGHQVPGEGFLPLWTFILVLVLSVAACAFWLGGKLLIFLGRKMRERGIKLP
jgi:fucose permease